MAHENFEIEISQVSIVNMTQKSNSFFSQIIFFFLTLSLGAFLSFRNGLQQLCFSLSDMTHKIHLLLPFLKNCNSLGSLLRPFLKLHQWQYSLYPLVTQDGKVSHVGVHFSSGLRRYFYLLW